jgi:hypothetical protein
MFDKVYWIFKNCLLTCEHVTGKVGYYVDNLFPASSYAEPCCYICRKGWFQILDSIIAEEVHEF